MSMDRSIWEAIGDLRARMKALEQRSGIRGAGTMAVAMVGEDGVFKAGDYHVINIDAGGRRFGNRRADRRWDA